VTHEENSDILDSGFDATVWRHNSTGQTYVSMTGSLRNQGVRVLESRPRI